MNRPPHEPLRPMSRRGDGPRRVPGGHRIMRESDHGPWPWPAEGWHRLLPASDSDEAAAGLAYARSGQIATLKIESGVVAATVQGHAGRPYTTTVRWAPLSRAIVDRFVSLLAADGAVAGAVLLDELPPRVELLLAEAGAELRPPDPEAGAVADEAVAVHCSCARATGCRHQVALAWLLQERWAEDPWRLLELRGLSRADLQDRIRLERRAGTESAETGPAEPGTVWTAPIGSFWRPGPSIGELDAMPPAHHAPLAILRRLGPSPLEGRFPLVGLLDSALEAIAQEGRRLSTIGDAEVELDLDEHEDGEAARTASANADDDPATAGENSIDRAGTIETTPAAASPLPKARRATAKRIDRGHRGTA